MLKYFIFIFCLFLFGEIKKESEFKGDRMIASDCDDAIKLILQNYFVPKTIPSTPTTTLETRLWEGIKNPRDFESFDEDKYLLALDYYKNKDLQKYSIPPKTLEEKMALIESIQLKFTRNSSIPSIQEESETLKKAKYKRLQKLFKKFNLDSNLTRDYLSDFSSELYLILKGPPTSVFDYLNKDKTVLMSERYMRILQENMLTYGLSRVVHDFPGKEETKLMKVRLFLKKIGKYKIWRYASLPYALPEVSNPVLSDALLEKILLDGLDAHNKDFIIELKNMQLIDHYDRFRKVYRNVAFTVLMYYIYLETMEQRERNEKEAKDKILKGIESLSTNLPEVEQRSEEELKEIQMQRVLKDFRAKYKEEPTADEFIQLHKQIFGH